MPYILLLDDADVTLTVTPADQYDEEPDPVEHVQRLAIADGSLVAILANGNGSIVADGHWGDASWRTAS